VVSSLPARLAVIFSPTEAVLVTTSALRWLGVVVFWLVAVLVSATRADSPEMRTRGDADWVIVSVGIGVGYLMDLGSESAGVVVQATPAG